MSPSESSQITPRKSAGLSVGEIIALLALIIGILLVITPVNALSRSAFLLIVLGASIYLSWGRRGGLERGDLSKSLSAVFLAPPI